MFVVLYLGFTSWLIIGIVVWSIAWKIAAMWRAGRANQKVWFVILALSPTLGALEIFYCMLYSEISRRLKVILSIILFGVIMIFLNPMGSSQQPVIDPPPRISARPWQRHEQNPLYFSGYRHADNRRELAISDPTVYYDEEDKLWKAWWSTTLGEYTDPVSQMVIKYAESRDGLTWDVQVEPAFSSRRHKDDWDYTNVETPSVVKNPAAPPERRYMLFYSGGNDELIKDKGFTWYQIGLAFSPDGKKFTRLPLAESPYVNKTTPFKNVEGMVLIAKDVFPSLPHVADGVVADPEVILKDEIFHMWFSSYGVDAQGEALAYGISYTTSRNGVHWTPQENNPIPSIIGNAHPTVVWNQSKRLWEMWFSLDSDEERDAIPSTAFTGIGFFYANSADGVNWTNYVDRGRDFVWDKNYPYEKHGILVGPKVVLHEDQYRLYYAAWGDQNVPEGFLTTTKSGVMPSVISLNMATLE